MNKQETWIDRFDEQFKYLKYFICKDNDFGDRDWISIKNFITEEIAKAKEEIVKRAKNEKFTVIKKPSGWFRGEHEIDLISYNIACDDIINQINNK